MTGDVQTVNLLGISGPSRNPHKKIVYFTRARITVCITKRSQKTYPKALNVTDRLTEGMQYEDRGDKTALPESEKRCKR